MKFSFFLILVMACLPFSTFGQKSPTLNPVFIVTDISGKKMEVKNMKILVVQGSDQNLTTSFTVMDGQSELTLDLGKLMGFKNFWKTREVEIYFPDKESIRAKLPAGVVFHQIKGKALVGGEEVPYDLEVVKLLSAFRKGFDPVGKSAE